VPDGVHQHVRRADLAGDPVDEPRRRGRVGGVGHLAADLVGELAQPSLVRSTATTVRPPAARVTAVA
jgi:hypothetical protein